MEKTATHLPPQTTPHEHCVVSEVLSTCETHFDSITETLGSLLADKANHSPG